MVNKDTDAKIVIIVLLLCVKALKKMMLLKQRQLRYLEGLCFRAIGRLLDISHQTVYRWAEQMGEQHPIKPNTNQDIDIVELDEIHSYTKLKNYCWTWIAIGRHTKQVLGFVYDYWKSYQEIIPISKHLRSKAQTFTIESYNGKIRHYLARFKRKTKCYSKCQKI